jgi:uncharacterized protein (DUF2236 family)
MGLLTIIVSNVPGEGAEDHHALADELILRAARTGVIIWVAASKCQPFSDATSVMENVF